MCIRDSFAGAQLERCNFAACDLTYADFRHAKLIAADMRQATMLRACLHGAATEGAQMTDRKRALESDPDLAEAEAWQPLAG